MGVSQREEMVKRTENLFNEIIAKIFQVLGEIWIFRRMKMEDLQTDRGNSLFKAHYGKTVKSQR